MIRDNIPLAWAGFLEAQAFFFIATANDRGECDCSFRGREFDASGQPYPLLKVQQAYPNCKARVPKMNFAPLADAFFDE